MELTLRRLRKENGMTQAGLGEKIGVSMRVVSGWERNEIALSLEDACSICDVFDCSLDELAGRWEYVGGGTGATPDEREIIDAYRDTDPRGRENILDTARREKRASGPPQVHQVRTVA